VPQQAVSRILHEGFPPHLGRPLPRATPSGPKNAENSARYEVYKKQMVGTVPNVEACHIAGPMLPKT
jgi:hypothetical protein